MAASVDILIPTYRRRTALAITLTSLCGQEFGGFRVVISDQTEDSNLEECGELQAVLRVLAAHGQTVEVHKHLPRRGMAEHRQYLLDQVTAPYCLFLDDDLILEPYVVGQMVAAIREEGCGFVGSAVIGLSYLDDVRPHEQAFELWETRVHPEQVVPDSIQWHRYRLHNAANVYHVQQRLCAAATNGNGADGPRQTWKYRVAWVGGCVLYDTAKLRDVGGFGFWKELPAEHCGEDVLAQQRVMARYGGCGIMPSGVYHQELPTTIVDRSINAPRAVRADLNGTQPDDRFETGLESFSRERPVSNLQAADEGVRR